MASTWAAAGSCTAVMTGPGSAMRICGSVSGNDGGTGAATATSEPLSMTGAAMAEMSGAAGTISITSAGATAGATSAFGLVVRRDGAFFGAGFGSAGASVAVSTPMVPFSAGAPDDSGMVVWLVASVTLPDVGSTSATAVAAVSETFFREREARGFGAGFSATVDSTASTVEVSSANNRHPPGYTELFGDAHETQRAIAIGLKRKGGVRSRIGAFVRPIPAGHRGSTVRLDSNQPRSVQHAEGASRAQQVIWPLRKLRRCREVKN